MRRDPAATFWVGLLGVGALLATFAIGALLLKPEKPPDHYDTVAVAVLVLGLTIAAASFLGLVHVGMENMGVHLRLHWPIALRVPLAIERDDDRSPTQARIDVAQAEASPTSRPLVADPKRQAKVSTTRLQQRGEIAIPRDVSQFSPEILTRIDAIVADGPAIHRAWSIEDRLGDHQSDSLPALLDDVIWETVTHVFLIAGVVPGGPLTYDQPASLTVSSGTGQIEYICLDPALLAGLQRTVYRIEQCFAGSQAEGD